MAAKKPKGYVATASFVFNHKGVRRFFVEGQYYADLTKTDIKGREHLFTAPEPPVEQATAAPGETRNVKPKD